MSSLRRLALLSGAAVLLLFVLGFFSWPVTGAVRWACDRLAGARAWEVSVERARWIPWRHLVLEDLRLLTPHGGRLHLEEVRVALRWGALLGGVCAADWRMGRLRMDPGSWGIRNPQAQQLLSAEPVAESGSAVLEMGPIHWKLESFDMAGPLLRLTGRGGYARAEGVGWLDLEGEVAGRILREMKMVDPQKAAVRPWEPFSLRAEGSPAQPRLAFASNFFSFSLGEPEASAP